MHIPSLLILTPRKANAATCHLPTAAWLQRAPRCYKSAAASSARVCTHRVVRAVVCCVAVLSCVQPGLARSHTTEHSAFMYNITHTVGQH